MAPFLKEKYLIFFLLLNDIFDKVIGNKGRNYETK